MREIKVSIFHRKDRKNIFMQYTDPVTKKKVRKDTGETSDAKARKVAGKWEAEINANYDSLNDGKMLWRVFRDRYEDDHIASLASETDRKISGVLNSFEKLTPVECLRDITPQLITAYQRQLRDMGRSENTIKGHLAHIAAALSWAVEQEFIAKAPKIKAPERAKKSTVMKGRPITTEEFERMLLAVDKVILKQEMCKPRKEWKTDYAKTDEWKLLLKGLYWSGLRLREAVNLHWTDANKLCVVNLLSGAPMLHIPAELDKGNEDRIMPMAPEFAELLKTIPEGDRRGFVFNPQPTRQRYSARLAQKRVGEILSKIGQTANVVVQKPSNGKVKFASAHDLRRSFGERWSMLVMPQVLKDLMRHENIQTTMRYYIGQNARLTSSVIWEAYNAATSSSYEGSLREEQ